MSKKLIRILCLVLSVILTLGLITGALVTIVSAATTTHQLAKLLTDGKIKAHGRTQVNTAGDGITANWSGNGFEMNVNATGGDFVVGYKTNLTTGYASILVDGKQVWRGSLAGTGTIKTTLTAGKHTVRVMREQGHTNSTTAYIHFTTVAFDGTVETPPANRSKYVEVIGDSYACGAGSAADYEPGVQWGDMDHSVQASFGWYLGKMLGADVSIVARGGIGLFDGTSAMEGTANTVTMRDIYPYASGHNQGDGEYSFERKPDLVVIELGANDSIDSSKSAYTMDTWVAKLQEMIQLVRTKNGANTKILLLSHTTSKYFQMLKIADADDKIWACHFAHHGNGSAALATQLAGHPNADDEYQIAEALYKSIQDWDILGAPAEEEKTYTDIHYYVSENGNDANDGKTLATAKKTIKATMDKVQADNGGKTGFAAKTRIVLNVEGQVYHSTTSHNFLGGGQAFYETGTGVKAHQYIPVLITTYNYSGTPATIVYDNDPTSVTGASLQMVNNVYLKDINIHSVTNEATGYAVHRIFASNTDLTIDNVSFTTDGKATAGSTKWSIFADHFGTGGFNPFTTNDWFPYYGTVTFKNGDYTNLEVVAAVGADSITSGQTTHTAHINEVNCKVVIEDGAKMGTVYGAYGAMGVKSVTVELNGGTVENYQPTRSGSSSAKRTYNLDLTSNFNGTLVKNDILYGTGNYQTINGNVTNNYHKGQYIGSRFAGMGSYVTLNGDLTNNITGGEIRVTPPDNNGGIHMSGYTQPVINGDVTNNISGGEISLVYNVTNVDSGIYMGSRSSGTFNGNLTNNISGGVICTFKDAEKVSSSGIYLGTYSGNISGTLTNNISGGLLDPGHTGGGLNFGDRTIGNKLGKIVNVIGVKDSLQGPRLYGNISLGGGWAYLGNYLGKRAPTADDCSDTVVLDTTIYGGYFSGAVYAGVNGASYTSGTSTTYSYVSGSVKTDIYGGMFTAGFYATSGAPVAGHVTANIHGGYFTSIYGTRSATVYDGVELNLYGMTEYYPVKADNTWGIWAGGNTGKVSAKTEGRAAVALNIAPKDNKDLVLNTPIYAGFASTGSATGTTTVSVSGGIYPKGFGVDGKTVGEVLASGSAVHNYITGAKATYAATDASVSGHVEVLASGESASRELVYYVRPNGNNSNDGTRFVTAKATVKAAIDQAVADNGGSCVFPNGSKLVIYLDGTVNDGSGQSLGYQKLLTTADGKHMETVLTTYNYTDTKATLVQTHTPTNSGSSSICLYTDITLKNVDMVSRKTSAGWVTQRVYASGCTLTLDNAVLKTDCGTKWTVAADYFSLGGVHPLNTPETYGTVIFRNGDYTNLSRVAAVNGDGIWRSEENGGTVKEVSGKHCKVIIEDGAKLGTVYNTYGTLGVSSATVEIRGGEVTTYYGTSSAGTDASKTYNTDEMNLIISGGKVNKVQWTGDANLKTTYDETDKTKVTGITACDLIINSTMNTTISGGTVNTLVGSGTIKTGSYVDSDSETQTVTGNVILNGAVTNTFSGGTIGSYTGTGISATVKETLITTVSGATVNAFKGTGDSAKLQKGMATTVSAGAVTNFCGTGAKASVTGNMTNTFSGGSIGGSTFYTLGNNSTLSKDMNNTFSGTAIEINPTSTTNGGHGIFLSGRSGVTVSGNVTNSISAGSLGVLYEVTDIKSGIYLGLRDGWINGNLTNNISGGELYTRVANKDIVPSYAGIHLTSFSGGSVKGTVNNNVIGGTFEVAKGSYYLGQQGVSGSMNKIVNVVGDKTTGNGPTFKGTSTLNLAGGWGRIGVTNNSGTLPAESATTDTVVVSNTIYGGNFGGLVNASLNATTGSNVTYIKGSVETNVYGGNFTTFYGNGMSPTYGHVTTNIYGGTFNAIYGNYSAPVYNGVELNIYGLTEGENPTGIFINYTGETSALTEGRNAVKLTIDPKEALTLSMPISVNGGTITGTTSVLVTGGTYTNGFAVAGVTVKEALKEGLVPLKDADKTIITVTDEMTTTGTDSVTLISTVWTEESAKLTLSDTTVTWDGETNAKVPTTTVKFYNTELTRGTDYSVSYSRDGVTTTELNTLGTVTVTATAKAPYSGTVSATYTIVRDPKVGEAIAQVTDAVNAFDEATVTADDKSALVTCKGQIDAILNTNAAVLTAQEETALNGLMTTIGKLESAIAMAEAELNTVTAAANGYSADTVTADNSAALTQLASDIAAVPDGNLTEAQKAEKKALSDKVIALQKVITDTAEALADAKTEAGKYDAATVTADDSAKLTQLASDIAAISDGNLTEAQKAEKKAAADTVTALQKVITDTAAELAAVKTEVNKYNQDTVSESDAADLSALATRIAAIPDANLTDAQKAEKKAAADKVIALQKTIGDVTAELAEVKTEANKVDAATVTADDSAALEALAQRIAAISDDKLTAAQKAEKQAAADKVAAAQQAIADAASKLADAKTAANAIDAATVTADDSAALTAAEAKVAAVPENNLTEAQKAEKQAAADKLAAARQAIADAASKLADAKTAANAFNAATVTADDSAALTAAKAKVDVVPDGNLTEAQKAEKQAASDKIAAMEKVITDTAEALTDAKAEADKFDPNTVNSENTEALAAAAAQIAAVPDGNLTEAQKAEKKAAADAVAAMQKTVADTAADLEALKAAEKAFDPATLTVADKAGLQALKQELEGYPTDHLTGGEKELLEQLAASVDSKIAAIDKAAEIAGDIDAIAKLLEGKTTQNITSESDADLIAARNAITEVKKNTGLSDADKQKVAQLEETLEALEEQLEKADAAAEIPASVQAVKPENVEPEDKTGLTAAIKALEDAQQNFAGNYTDAEKQAIADKKAQLQAALAVIEQVEAVQQQITQLPATAEPDDEQAIAQLQAALDAFAAMNDRQKAMVTAAQLEKMDKLGASLRDYKIIKGDKATWTQASKKDLSFTVNGLFGKFEGVQVDGSTVDSKYYTVKSGSTIITLTDEFLDKLEKGEHTITVVYTDGKVTGSFTVKAKSASPATGDETNIALLSLLAVFSAASAAAITVGMKKRKQ